MATDEILKWAVALGAGAILQIIVRYVAQRKKMGADAAKAITEAATALVEPLTKRVAELQKEVTQLRTELVKTQQALEHAEEVARLVADTAWHGQKGLRLNGNDEHG